MATGQKLDTQAISVDWTGAPNGDRTQVSALMRRDKVSGWSQGIAAVRTVAADPIAANSIARKWASENLATIWSSMGRLDLEVE